MSNTNNIIVCDEGCCSLKIFQKEKKDRKGIFHPFEKRKAGVVVYYQDHILLTQSYNNYWGIPKGQMELIDESIKKCAERELREETGLDVTLVESDLYRILLDNCYVYKHRVENMDIVDLNNLNLDSTGIGWVKFNCAFNFDLNLLTKKIIWGIDTL